MTRFIIMADGKSRRWGDSENPKQLAVIGGETLLQRLVRQLSELAASEVIITSHNPAFETAGARRHEPLNNHRELDRFTAELICDDCCFLYGDTYYSSQAIATIAGLSISEVGFVGNGTSIVAIVVKDSQAFKQAVAQVDEAIANGELVDGKGWQVYSAYVGQPLASRDKPRDFLLIDGVFNVNTIDDYHELLEVTDSH